jgi:hypothetical protein
VLKAAKIKHRLCNVFRTVKNMQDEGDNFEFLRTSGSCTPSIP